MLKKSDFYDFIDIGLFTMISQIQNSLNHLPLHLIIQTKQSSKIRKNKLPSTQFLNNLYLGYLERGTVIGSGLN